MFCHLSLHLALPRANREAGVDAGADGGKSGAEPRDAQFLGFIVWFERLTVSLLSRQFALTYYWSIYSFVPHLPGEGC